MTVVTVTLYGVSVVRGEESVRETVGDRDGQDQGGRTDQCPPVVKSVCVSLHTHLPGVDGGACVGGIT